MDCDIPQYNVCTYIHTLYIHIVIYIVISDIYIYVCVYTYTYTLYIVIICIYVNRVPKLSISNHQPGLNEATARLQT
jgi:hypothetical protein